MDSVSVIIPCYNLGPYLPEAIASVRRQTKAPRELIVVDDGSTDRHTLAVLEELEAEGVCVYHTPNRGAPAARNYGIERSSSPFILCLDADDVLMPEHLALTSARLGAAPSVGIVTPHVEFFGNTQGIWKTSDYAPTRLLWQNCIASASLFRRRCWEEVGGYVDLPACQDWNFWIAIVERGWKWDVVPVPLYRYRVRSGSISERGRAQRAELLRRIVDAHRGAYEDNVADILIQMDASMSDLRTRLGKYAEDNRRQSGQIESLQAALMARKAEMHALQQALAAARKTPTNGHAAKHAAAPSPSTRAHTRANGKTEKQESRPAQTDRDAEQAREATAAQAAYRRSIKRLHDLLRQHVPAGCVVAYASRGDEELVAGDDWVGWHFPQTDEGVYAGCYPADSREAIDQVERLRDRGADFLVFPSTSLWWLEHYSGLNTYLRENYTLVEERPGHCALFSLVSLARKQAAHYNRFSVVICTYRRADLLRRSIESLFTQVYPRDKFEIIVVDNASPDDTERVAQEYGSKSPVPFTYCREERNGLSYARNRGIEQARFEYVAHLDDDARACPDWLRAFNDVINRHSALVVGGRVEKEFVPGFEPPAWFNFQYMKGFFGLNYRDWGKRERVFRIHYPRYIGGGNSVYAKRLYDYFGGYDPRLGRDGKTLLAGEETYLNLQLDRHDIPIYYSDDAAIHHFVDCSRITQKHILRKARWSGITNAIITNLVASREETRQKLQNVRKEVKRLAWKLVLDRRSQEHFSRRCRMRYLTTFLTRLTWLRVRRRLGSRFYAPAAVDWNPQQWVEELEALPESADKYRALRHFHLAMGNCAAAARADAKLRTIAAAQDVVSDYVDFSLAATRFSHRRYEQMIDELRAWIVLKTPPRSQLIVVSKGDPQLVEFENRTGWHFPQDERGDYAGYHPADSQAAITAIRRACAQGGDFLVFPETARWWLSHYAEFAQFLEAEFGPAVHADGLCTLFDLRRTATLSAVSSRRNQLAYRR